MPGPLQLRGQAGGHSGGAALHGGTDVLQQRDPDPHRPDRADGSPHPAASAIQNRLLRRSVPAQHHSQQHQIGGGGGVLS